MTNNVNSRNPFAFTPIILDQDSHEKRRIIQQLPSVHRTETLEKFFGASADHLFDAARGKSINGYVGQRPLWYDPNQDYYLEERNEERSFYQLEASMVSKDEEGRITSLLPYPDLLNQLRFQGALTDNHNRLFSQDYYTWCPPIDLDKLLNFRQYVWLPLFQDSENPENSLSYPVVEITGPSNSGTSDGVNQRFYLPGYGPEDDIRQQDFYDLNKLVRPIASGPAVDHWFTVRVDGVAIDRTMYSYNSGDDFIDFVVSPPTDSEVTIHVYSDIENNAIGLSEIDSLAFGGIQLSSGMRIIFLRDDNLDLNDSQIYIIENVGKSIFLIEEKSENHSLTPDYITMARGCENQNEWSTGNRWFHVSTLSEDFDDDLISRSRANRPIIEFERDLELYNYGFTRRLPVDLVVESVEDFAAFLNQNPTSMTLEGQTITIQPSGINTTAYGDVESIRLMIRNTVSELFNNKIFVLINQGGSFRVVLEKDGRNPSGDSEYGEVIGVKLGTYAGRNLHFNGSSWITGQEKTQNNQFPLFELYDIQGISLRDLSIYPNSNFQGSRIFGYRVDTSTSRPTDSVLGFPLMYDNRGQIQFENYLSTQSFEWIQNGSSQPITGFYFHKTSAHDFESQQLSNDWFKASTPSRQSMVDRFIADGRTRTFRISQIAQDITVEVGRLNDTNGFDRTILTEDRDFIRVGRDILLIDVKAGDIIDIRTFNSSTPPEDATGHYEIPLNLQANPDNEEVSVLTKGDFYDHFSAIIKKQYGFQGEEFSVNNYRDTPKEKNLGLNILQHSSAMLKTMLLASDLRFDIMNSIRFVEGEYARFKDKFQQKVMDLLMRGVLSQSDSDDLWIDRVLEDINRGKNKKFPFYLSEMGRSDPAQLPSYIPPTPSFLGVYPLYTPQMFTEDRDDNNEIDFFDSPWFIRGHDGSISEIDNQLAARVILALEQRIYDSVKSEIRNRERPLVDWKIAHGDQFRRNEYSYDEYLKLLRPSFERWAVTYRQDYRINDSFDNDDLWTWNWSSIITANDETVPGHWRGIYEKFFGTQRPDLYPWESLGFTEQPLWWEASYGPAPYTADNLKLWRDLELGLIRDGDRKGINQEWARPGLSDHIPVDGYGRLRHPGPRWLPDDNQPPLDPSESEDFYRAWEFASDSAVLGCDICPNIPSPVDRAGEWDWGDIGPVEQLWRSSSSYSFSISQVSYLMKPAKFVELGWNTEDTQVFFPGTIHEQIMSFDTKGRPRNRDLRVHGETLEDFSQETKTGIQQWISDYLTSRSISIDTSLGDAVRGLGSQLSYKVGGFTDSTTLVVGSDAFGRVPAEDVSVNLFRSPSIREEFYSGVAVEWKGNGYEIYGYDSVNPFFSTIPGSSTGGQIAIGDSVSSSEVPFWRPNTYYSVNITVRHENSFYRCVRTHTSSSVFEGDFWTEVARPEYADGSRLLWSLNSDPDEPITSLAYGTVLKKPQDVADFLNGYQRFLESRGWIFEDSNEDDTETRDWKTACRNFIVWSSGDLQEGDFISLSPSSTLLRYRTEHGAIQPVEQIINGFYSIVDQNGNPIDSKSTRVVRNDGDISISLTPGDQGIFGLRLYVSEIEHVLVFNNQTIFNDTIYSPLLNIKQPRLRVQGFKSIAWQGRIDAPGFIVTGDTLTPNFERAADDFRRFFDIEPMENKDLQDRARANFGYEEKEYLNNLLLSPASQFEFYQGMIQQKGSPTSMRRLLRSSFIRHNKGLRLFEEWAFRIGDYGGQDVQPQLDVQIQQSEFKHNPQLIVFDTIPESQTPEKTFGVIRITDRSAEDQITEFDSRWYWRPDTKKIKWPLRNFEFENAELLKTSGPVKLDEVRFTCPTYSEFNEIFGRLEGTSDSLNDRDRVWVYGIGEINPNGSPNYDAWGTFKFNDTGFNISDVLPSSFEDQSVVVVLDQLVGNSSSNDPDSFFILQEGRQERLIFRNLEDSELSPLSTYVPRFKGLRTFEVSSNTSSRFDIMELMPAPDQYIKSIKINVLERFEPGSTLTIGHDLDSEHYIGIKEETPREIFPTNFDDESVLVQTPPTSFVSSNATTAPVEMIRVGRVENFCSTTEISWEWIPVGSTTPTQTGTASFIRPSDFEAGATLEETYLRVADINLTPGQDSTSGEFVVRINGVPVPTDRQNLSFVRANAVGVNQRFVDLTTPGIYEFTINESVIGQGSTMLAEFFNSGFSGRANVDIEYFFKKGFEAYNIQFGEEVITSSNDGGGTADIYSWIETRYPTLSALQATNPLMWDDGDVVEIDNDGQGLWEIYRRESGAWTRIRGQNQKINSHLLTSAAIFNSKENRLKLVLQLYDPAKGFIPGVAERELDYRIDTDPANYVPSVDDRIVWGKEQVGRLWWNTSEIRYLDYEIYDGLNKDISYRWKNWGRVVPGLQANIYEWVRSPVPPSGWVDYVTSQSSVSNSSSPSGTVDNQTTEDFVTLNEWNEETQSEELAYYFWVKNPNTLPRKRSRRLSAQQVSNIITNPSSNDIPFFAVIDEDKVIVGGIKQFLDEDNTILKIKWEEDTEIVNNHHKHWILLREEDERNTIEDQLWNKMRDSLVGWDGTTVESKISAPMVREDTQVVLQDASKFSESGIVDIGGNLFTYQGKTGNTLLNLPAVQTIHLPTGENQIPVGTIVRQGNIFAGKPVPDHRLPRPQQLGNLVRPRQSWFPTDILEDSQRVNRGARESFVDSLNDILSKSPFIDLWFNWREVFDRGEDLPRPDRYVRTALDLDDLQLLVPATLGAVQLNECVLIENTSAAGGIWTLWKMVEISGNRTFILEDFQKWRFQEGEMWSLADWYAEGWSVRDFPNYRFPTFAARDAAGNLDVTLLKGTLVQIDQQSPLDLRWSWEVYTSTTKIQVAKKDSTIRLNSAFFDNQKSTLGPNELREILGSPFNERITPQRIQELANIMNNRDGSLELEFLINTFRTELLDTIQKNKLFFSSVKSALKQNTGIDWAFKTSFLYLGGYSENLRQSPVAFKDQIDNVIAYLEEVKPYHVKIREYVRRLSFGPDLADLTITDFDKPVYLDGSNYRLLDESNPVDLDIMRNSRPWSDWLENYEKTNYNLAKWDLDWNPVRKLNVTVKIDRVACSPVIGWDTFPWSPNLQTFTQGNDTSISLKELNELYRNVPTDGSPNFYRDTVVNTIEERNLLVRQNIVTASRPGTIVTVLRTDQTFMWTGSDWVQFQVIGWDTGLDMGSVSRIDQSYRPNPGGIPREDAGLIAGCEFQGTTITRNFKDGAWNLFEWGSTGLSSEYEELIGLDVERIDGNSTPIDESDPAYIKITGNQFSQPQMGSGRPHEMIPVRGIDHLIITMRQDDGNGVEKIMVNGVGKSETTFGRSGLIEFLDWDQSSPTSPLLRIRVGDNSEDAQGYTPLHDPQNPSTGFIRDVLLSRGYQAKIRSGRLLLVDSVDENPFDRKDDQARVAIVHPDAPGTHVIATVTSFTGGELTLDIPLTSLPNYSGAKKWNIIPLDLFNEAGVIWVGNARFTYSEVVDDGNDEYRLINAKLSGGTLYPLNFGTQSTMSSAGPLQLRGFDSDLVFDGSKHRIKTSFAKPE